MNEQHSERATPWSSWSQLNVENHFRITPSIFCFYIYSLNNVNPFKCKGFFAKNRTNSLESWLEIRMLVCHITLRATNSIELSCPRNIFNRFLPSPFSGSRRRFSRPGPKRRFPQRSRWWPLVKLAKPPWIELEFTRPPKPASHLAPRAWSVLPRLSACLPTPPSLASISKLLPPK